MATFKLEQSEGMRWVKVTLDNDDDVRQISAHRVIITDIRKLRYQVRDIAKLDVYSRRALERYL